VSLSVEKNHLDQSPVHVAIIMDGNRRWAKRKGLKSIFGHREGAKAVKRAVETAVELGIAHLTLFGFSSENWNRTSSEISSLLGLLRLHLKQDLDEMDSQGVRIEFIGDLLRFPRDINDLMLEAENKTKKQSKAAFDDCFELWIEA